MTGAITYSAANAFPGPPPLAAQPDLNQLARWARGMNIWGQHLMTGKLNNVGELTLDASTTDTVFLDPRVNINSMLMFHPLTDNAAQDFHNSSFRVSNQRNGQFTLTHQSGAQTDKRFRYLIMG